MAKESTLSDVIERMDRIEAALNKLVAAVERGGVPGAGSARGSSGVGQPAGPPIVKVAPPRAAGAKASKASSAPSKVESIPTSTQKATADQAYNPYPEAEFDLPPANASIVDVLTCVFKAVLMPDAEDTWAWMTMLTHSSQMVGPRALDHFKAFAWHKARRSAAVYLADDSPSSYTIDYTEPSDVDETVNRVKAFLKRGPGMLPAPVVFERDPLKDNAWRVSNISL